jgi:galactofuranosylgalactofuranosylrhamnosyl-N-acetylglucosaminyl-diphospho-decaprenol beta-1,5/1,6-galactofuranosyltransferase
MRTINTNIIKLQSIVLQKCIDSNESKLYWNIEDGGVVIENNNLHLDVNSKVSFFSYFNSFSIQKWSKLTNIRELYMLIKVKGNGKINVCNAYLENQKVSKEIIQSQTFSYDDAKEINFIIDNLQKFNGSIYFEIESFDEEVDLLKAEYRGKVDIEKLNEVKLNLVICTYKREEYVMNNLRLLENTLQMNESLLHRNLMIYVVDNGNTLRQVENKYFRIIPNKNLGGSGGFTRGLVEAIESGMDFSNVILMDDDVEILPEALERLYSLLRVIKGKYKSSIISGSMLQLDKKYMLHESTGRFIGRGFEPVKYKLDLTSEYNILFNETEQDISNHFAAWWFCCIPKVFIKEDNLPLPFFIKGDDVEYSLRNTNSIIHLNGIGIWHEPFEKKYAQVNTFYYEIRNFLIITALYFKDYNKFKAIKFILERYARESLRYRYKSTDLIIEAVKDFLKGTKFFTEVNEEDKHKNLSEKSYKLISIDDIKLENNISSVDIKEECNISQNEDNSRAKFVRVITINGYFLPKIFTHKNRYKYKIVSLISSKHINYYRNIKILNVLIDENKGFITDRRIGKFIKDSFRIGAVCMKLLFKYNRIRRDYKVNSKELKTKQFWQSKFK